MLHNTTKNTSLTNTVAYASSLFEKTKGLMFTKQHKHRALIFPFNQEKTQSLHMLFVFYPIDVIFLNKDKKIVELKENFKPFTSYTSKEKAQYILELPKNTIKQSQSSVGDSIRFK
ncbi:MAG: DUF192 domain-containing protein [Nanoarchaeota archaeon]|nr:DUF192 domain-containing protein [Nanoarchaeota archaeon]